MNFRNIQPREGRRAPAVGTRLASAGFAIALFSAALFGASTAAAATTYKFTGNGWGHGVGMSQYGAKGGAEVGKTYKQILAHYYTGTTVTKQSMPGGLRLGLQQGVGEVTILTNGPFHWTMSGKKIAKGIPNKYWKVQPTSTGSYRVTSPDGKPHVLGDRSKALGVRFSEYGSRIRVNGTRYVRGWLELNTHPAAPGGAGGAGGAAGGSGQPGGAGEPGTAGSKWGLRTILHLAPFETYLYGLAEMPTSWHKEALKAQVVAARTYAFEKMKTVGLRTSCNCHLYDDTRHQVYAGYEKETGTAGARWKSMVDATAGQVILYRGAPIKALYSSSSGGYTESNDMVWSADPVPYLRAVSDPWDKAKSPYLNWSVTFSKEQLQQRFRSRDSTDVGTFQTIDLLSPRGKSGRVTRVISADRGGVRLVGNSGTKRVGGETLRSVLGLRSALTKLTKTG